MQTSLQEFGFWQRYRQLFNRRGQDFWSVVFGYPVARFFVVLLLPVSAVTPTLLTLLGFVTKIGCALLLWPGLWGSGGGSVWLLVALLQVAQVFDSMDGTLARARQDYSKIGGFLDKITDAIGLYAITVAVGVRAAQETGDWWHAVLGGVAGACFLLLCYMYWVVVAAQGAVTAARMAGAAEPLPWRKLGLEWLRGWRKIVSFGEADLYMWIALFAALDRWAECVYLLVATQGAAMLKRSVDHLRTLSKHAQ